MQRGIVGKTQRIKAKGDLASFCLGVRKTRKLTATADG